MKSPLQGLRVLENAQVITGPMTGMMLADLGADVIKVEPPQRGDSFRRWEGRGDNTISSGFAAYNRGKRSLALDTKTPEGKELYKDLATSVDVVIENFRPGVMDRAGLGWSALREINPGLVYCQITGLGSVGPEAGRPTYDAVAQALSGLWSQFTDMADPRPVGPPLADQLTALYATTAVLAALQARSRTGRGDLVEVSMLSSCMAFQTQSVTQYLRDDLIVDQSTRARLSQSYSFVGAEGLPFCIHLSSPDKFWRALCEATGLLELLSDDRFKNKSSRDVHYDELREVLQQKFGEHPRDYWLARLSAAEVPAAPILRMDEAVRHPQIQALGLIQDQATHPAFGVASAIAVDHRYLVSDRAVPQLGEHSTEVLEELRSHTGGRPRRAEG